MTRILSITTLAALTACGPNYNTGTFKGLQPPATTQQDVSFANQTGFATYTTNDPLFPSCTVTRARSTDTVSLSC